MKFRISKFEMRNGFTLLEVVVAMAIVGLGVVTILEIFSLGLRLGSRSFERSEAIALGREVMDEFLSRKDLSEGREEGSRGQKQWSFEVQPVNEDLLSASDWELKEVALELRYSGGERERRVELRTLRLVRKKSR